MASKTLNSLAEIHDLARSLLKGNGPERILVCNDAGLAVLDVHREGDGGQPDPVESALAAEVASTLFGAGSELLAGDLRSAELRSDGRLLAVLHEPPFTLVAFWPLTAQQGVAAPFEEGFQRLFVALQEELT